MRLFTEVEINCAFTLSNVGLSKLADNYSLNPQAQGPISRQNKQCIQT